MLWYMNSYSETKGTLKEVCALIAREVSAKIKGEEGGTLAENLKEVNGVCNETPLWGLVPSERRDERRRPLRL